MSLYMTVGDPVQFGFLPKAMLLLGGMYLFLCKMISIISLVLREKGETMNIKRGDYNITVSGHLNGQENPIFRLLIQGLFSIGTPLEYLYSGKG